MAASERQRRAARQNIKKAATAAPEEEDNLEASQGDADGARQASEQGQASAGALKRDGVAGEACRQPKRVVRRVLLGVVVEVDVDVAAGGRQPSTSAAHASSSRSL